MTDYRIAVAEGVPRELARAWLTLGVAALIGSGLLAILLVLSRTPGMQHVFPLRDFFRSALVVHVDLSVLVWFMAFAAVLWSVAGDGRHAGLGRAGFRLAATGTGVLTASPFFPDAQPLLNNYIPVLQQPVFFAGLAICGAGFGLALLRALLTIPWKPGSDGTAVLRFGTLLGAIAGTLAFAGFALSWVLAPAAEGQSYYEVVFWGGGHALQFQHALLLVVAWFWLASELGHGLRIAPSTAAWLFAVAALPLLAVPAIYTATPVGSGWHMAWFARLMEAGHPFMTPLILVAAAALWRARSVVAPAKSAFAASVLLFAIGGVLAFLIKGVNVVIPAHYHGSIVGVTLAFMGLAYVLLPQLGFATADGRMARWQPYVYGGGQLIHILGLAWSGGYGVQRKVAGAEQVLTTLPQKIGMGMMGTGGLIAVIGGVMFVLVCLQAMRAKAPVNGPR
jgi:cytochrome c oxidase subunit I